LLKKYINTLIALSITLEEEGGERRGGVLGNLRFPRKIDYSSYSISNDGFI